MKFSIRKKKLQKHSCVACVWIMTPIVCPFLLLRVTVTWFP